MSTTPDSIPAPIPEEAQAPVNSFGRIVGALVSPKATFESIGRRPNWIAPIVLMIVVGAGMGAMLAHRVNWEQVVEQSLDQSNRAAQLSPPCASGRSRWAARSRELARMYRDRSADRSSL